MSHPQEGPGLGAQAEGTCVSPRSLWLCPGPWAVLRNLP